MTYVGCTDGEKSLRLTADEVKLFEAGKPVVKRTADCNGHIKITVKMTRPRTKKARFAGL